MSTQNHGGDIGSSKMSKMVRVWRKCSICFDEIDVHSSVEHLHQQNPCKAYSCCSSCAMTYIDTKVKDKQVTSEVLVCPAGCGEPLMANDVRIFLRRQANGADTLRRFQETLTEANAVQTSRDRRLNRLFITPSELRQDLAFHMWRKGSNSVRFCHHENKLIVCFFDTPIDISGTLPRMPSCH
jgi:hypothetical protein